MTYHTNTMKRPELDSTIGTPTKMASLSGPHAEGASVADYFEQLRVASLASPDMKPGGMNGPTVV